MRKILAIGSIGIVILLVLITFNPVANVQATRCKFQSEEKITIYKNILTIKNDIIQKKINFVELFLVLKNNNVLIGDYALIIFLILIGIVVAPVAFIQIFLYCLKDMDFTSFLTGWFSFIISDILYVLDNWPT